MEPSILKLYPDKLLVTLIVPVAVVHVGCVTLAVGAEADGGTAAIVKLVTALVQPEEFVDVIL